MENEKRRYDSLILSKTLFGWIASGQPRSPVTENTGVFTTFVHDDSSLEGSLRKFWEIEEVSPNIDRLTPEERECENLFANTHERTTEGRYVVKLPIKKDSGRLGDSLRMATTRFLTLERKLAKNQELRDAYISQMREYINLGHMIEVPAHEQNREIYYLPHHPVIKVDSDTTKVRVVFDGSSKTTSEELFERQSKLQRIYRIVAYVLRFINTLKNKKLRTSERLTASEIKGAKLKCIMWVQHMVFGEDIQNIRRHKRVNNKSRLLSLTPFIDEDGILRVGGRLQNSDCDYDSKHPIILPQKHVFTTRVIWDVHLSKLHAGPTLTASHIRQNYWIINGRSRIRSILRECVICTRYTKKMSKQIMGNLPAERVTPTRPFENCGIDFAGPIYLTARKGRGCGRPMKGYICVFVCLSVKAIHIEGVTDLTSEAFLAALKRFNARRGLPRRIYTDNGSNFIGARRILEQACKLIRNINNDYIIAEFLSQNGIEWHFIPPLSPHFGGLWEAAVKSVKKHLLRATHNINITFEEMTTLLCQIESILNSRPLYTSSAEDDFEVLTPTHFLIGTSATSIPELEINQQGYRLSRWQAIQQRIQLFWKRYYLEYLNTIQQRHKWQNIQNNFKIGDIVLLREDNAPVCKWPFGRVIQVHPGSDGLVRVVTLKTSSSILQRPVEKLCKLLVGG